VSPWNDLVASEAERIARLRAIFGSSHAGVALAIGDDAAILDAPRAPLCWSIDCAVEHVHFERIWLDGERLGYRATMAALSDLAAMGARPAGVLASLVLPTDVDEAWIDAIARGQRSACDDASTAVIGGNLSRGAELSITTTVLGTAERPMRRDAARAGDSLWLAGEIGLARIGLGILKRGSAIAPHDRRALDAWLRPKAELAAGLLAAKTAQAAIDLSDGLAIDAARMAAASEVAIELDEDALVTNALRDAISQAALRIAPLDVALMGGEDYALLVATREPLHAPFRKIGTCREPSPSERGAGTCLWLRSEAGARALVPRGFDHFE
jgi:thiamine-monophosphate kinase